jgi:uncharacterized protein YceH (UPF0502 family)
VLGVLVEKAKTTPDSYPMTLNALKNGCNQKNNRFPQMQLEDDQVEESLERLREMGAVIVIQGDGRVEKFRHRAYEWLGVEKVELAVMAELLLRGAQTVGELRGRAARMEPIPGMEELRPLLESLENKKLIVHLTPPGRGAVVTHALYLDREWDKVRREYGAGSAPDTPDGSGVRSAPPARPASAPSMQNHTGRLGEVSAVQSEIRLLRAELQEQIDALRRDLDQLNRQLGN